MRELLDLLGYGAYLAGMSLLIVVSLFVVFSLPATIEDVIGWVLRKLSL